MTLRVEFDQFASTVSRMLGAAPAFITRHSRGTVVTAADPSKNVRVQSRSPLGPDKARDALAAAGLEVLDGEWVLPDDQDAEAEGVYVVGIAYASGEGRSGLWMDATRDAITPAEAVRAMYDEMRENGEVADVTFEDFVRAANPNVVVLSPYDLKHFLASKDE